MGVQRKTGLVLVLILSFVSGCERETRPSPDEIKMVLGDRFPALKEPARAVVSNGCTEAYLDGSESCAGFVRQPSGVYGETKYCHLLHSLRVWLESQTGVRYFRFGDTVTSILNCGQAGSADFYRDENTGLDALVEEFGRRDSLSAAETYLVVTDGVPSVSSRRDLIDLAQPIADLVNKGYHFSILGTRSEFRGRVFSEIRGGAALPTEYSSDDWVQRPFYVLVLSLDPGLAGRLRTMVSRKGIELNAFHLASRNFMTTDPAYSVPTVGDRSRRNTLRMYGEQGGVAYLLLSFGRGTSPGNLDIAADLSPMVKDAGFRIDGSDVNIIARRVHLRSSEIVEPECRLVGLEQVPSLGSQTTYSLAFGRTGARGWSACRIMVCAGEAMLQPPLWIDEWSCSCDTQLEDFGRTLFLKDLVECVIAAVWKPPLITCYLAIKEV